MIALGCLVLGFKLGSWTSTLSHEVSLTHNAVNGSNKVEERGNEDVLEEKSDGNLAAVKAKAFEQCKLVRLPSKSITSALRNS